MTFYSSLFTSPLHFRPFLDSKTFSSTSFRPQCSKHPHQLMRLALYFIISHAPHNRRVSYVWLLTPVHTGGDRLGVWLAQVTEGGVPSLTRHTPPSSGQKHCSFLSAYQRLNISSTILPFPGEVKMKSQRISLDLTLFYSVRFFFLPFPFVYLWSFMLDLSFSTHSFSWKRFCPCNPLCKLTFNLNRPSLSVIHSAGCWPQEAQTLKGEMRYGLGLREHERCDQSNESSRKERVLVTRESVRRFCGGSGLEG